jgi:signal transduction histidine kinase/ligand-binding sensor domain-containing protein/DNA-binding response OmpR family regulator
MKWITCFLVFCMSVIIAQAQMVRVLNLKDGLSNNYVECILQDESGYIWIGTRDGLNRYNGHQNEVYKTQLLSSFIYSLMQDKSGRIWIGTSRGGVSIYHPKEERFEPLTIKGKPYTFLHDKDVYTMFEDSEHNVWLGTLQGLARIRQSKDTVAWYQHHSSAFSHSFTAFCEDRTHKLWFGTNEGLYFLRDKTADALNPERYQHEELNHLFIRDIREDAKGNLWMATDTKGIFRMNPEQGTLKNYSSQFQSGFKSNQVWKLFIDRYGVIWAALINGGIYRYDEASDKFVSYQSKVDAVFNSESITDILEDFNGNIWITSHGDGVCYFNPHKYVFEKYLSGQSTGGETKASVVSAFAEDERGDIWIGTDGDGIRRMSKQNKIDPGLSVRDGLSSNIILDIIPDRQGKWLATWKGGVDFVDARNRVKVYDGRNAGSFGVKMPNVKALLKDTANNIWMASHGGGLTVYSTEEQKFIDLKELSAMHTADVAQWGSDIIQSRRGDVWVGSHAGLFRYSGDSIYQYFPFAGNPNAISGSLIYCLMEDHEGSIWIGTNISLEKYHPDTGHFENFTALYGIPGNIKCMLEDSKHHLWFSTIDQIIELDPETKKTRRFDQAFNTQLGQFYECACLKSSSGKFFFGGTEGFNAFYPDSVKTNQQVSRVFLTDLFLFNKKQWPGAEGSVLKNSLSYTDELILGYDQNVVSFEFLALDYSSFDKNLYSYQMENFDQSWSPPGNGRVATYTNLDPGTYVFKVRSVSVDNAILSETSLRIKVVPPFWKTGWFRVLAFAFVVLAIVTFFINRLLSSRKKRLLLQKLVDIRTKEVRDKNLLLEQQTEDLRHKNEALVVQESKIREQANALAEQRNQLVKNNETLEDLNATKDRLFSIIAHDLRSPFTSLLGFSRLLNSDFDRYTEEEKLKLVRGMYKSSTSIHSLLENLLVWSKAQQNFLVFSPEKLFFRKVVAEHFDFIKDEAEKKNVRLHLAGDEEIAFVADRNMLNIVFRNLLSNALKYSPFGGRIEISGRLEGDGLEISVIDEGIGIEEGVNLFSVSRDDVQMRDHNHGLGLILCKEFVEKHGGKIYAGNNPERGSHFTFTLPSCNPSIVEDPWKNFSHQLEAETSNVAPSVTHQELPVVLLAEDDDQIRWYIKQIMFPDFQVIEAVNGADGAALALEKIPDIIVSDLHMRKMDGLEFCRQVKSHQQTSHIPFIMLTAERSEEKKVSGFQYGADDFINKPIEPNVLRARLHNLIENRKRLKSVYQQDITSAPEAFTNNPVDQSFLEKLNDIIEGQLSNPELNPDHLASEMSMSRTGLYMKVKALTGESVGIYIRNIRLKESKKLLKTRQMNISEVAYAVGFNQLPYFTTCFKEAFGITPTEYIKERGAGK